MGCCYSEPNPYGWGTQIRLNEDQCKALGLTEPLRAGTRVTIIASAFIKESTETVDDEGQEKESDVCMTVQITDMEMTPEAAVKSAARALYGDKQE